ncbi:hypothetical protein EGT74_13300 [Chitinophaga lutea]|uniref:histidine kinase n=2 Tax=Chitinophaga lutea TaxID=2488634 RepID=A0A3N4Q8K9_9BACT|nr:hypothetical protein EGT74_13300 [Chitinophaga lutea]
MGIPSIQLTTGRPYQKAGQQIMWFADSSAQLSFSDIQQAGYQQRFSQGLQEIGAFGLFNGAVWAHGSFSSPAPGKAYLLIEFSNIDSITLYYYDGPALKSITSGSRVVPRNNVWNLPGFSFELPAFGDRQQEFWLRIRTGNAMIVPVTLATEKGVWQALGGMYVVELIYFGIVIALFFYNLSLFAWIRDRSYIFYLGYLFFLAAFVLLYLRGFHVVFPEPVSRALNLYGIGFVGASYLFAIPFSVSFLKGREYAPRLTRLLAMFFIVAAAAVICCLAGWRHATIRMQEVISIAVPVLFISMAVVSYRQGYKPAVYFLVAWTLLLGTIMLFTVINIGLLPLKNWYFHILPVGSAVEVILLSLALGYRYSLLKKEKMAETESKMNFIRDQNELLEKKVDERTHALKESNRVKDKLLGIISHDLRTPLNNLSGLLELSEKKALSAGEIQHFSQTVRQNIKYIAGTIQNMLNWSLTQMERIETRPRKVDLDALAYLVVDIYRFAADQKAILLRKPMPEAVAVKADYHQLELVLRNLVDNAIKFTSQGGIITLGCRPVDEGVEIYVSDTGKGMSVEEIQRLLYGNNIYSTEGTDDERGTGLGLQLCKEFIANNGGVLRINSKPGKGTEFYFVLPRWE